MPAPRTRSAGLCGWFVGIALAFAGCSPSTTPGFPTPDFQAPLDAPFPLRVGDLGYVQSSSGFIYLSIQTVGADSRCPPAATCEDPGWVELTLELETVEAQGSIGMQVNPETGAIGTFHGFEIRVLAVEPPGREARILATEYTFLMTVALRQQPARN